MSFAVGCVFLLSVNEHSEETRAVFFAQFLEIPNLLVFHKSPAHFLHSSKHHVMVKFFFGTKTVLALGK